MSVGYQLVNQSFIRFFMKFPKLGLNLQKTDSLAYCQLNHICIHYYLQASGGDLIVMVSIHTFVSDFIRA